jgi:RNA polymerase sigma-70 factor (ECF subfamily)
VTLPFERHDGHPSTAEKLRDQPATGDARQTLPSLYRAWFTPVVQWLRALGAPQADLEDLAQEVFLVTGRRLGDFDGRNTAGWLYRIACGQLRQHRRRFWFQALAPRGEQILDEVLDDRPSALAEVDTAQRLERLARILGPMSENRRSVFLLRAIEGYRIDEISVLLEIPINTVKTRLHRARKDFARLLAEQSAREGADD